MLLFIYIISYTEFSQLTLCLITLLNYMIFEHFGIETNHDRIEM